MHRAGSLGHGRGEGLAPSISSTNWHVQMLISHKSEPSGHRSSRFTGVTPNPSCLSAISWAQPCHRSLPGHCCPAVVGDTAVLSSPALGAERGPSCSGRVGGLQGCGLMRIVKPIRGAMEGHRAVCLSVSGGLVVLS